jgi:hypothetical protein
MTRSTHDLCHTAPCFQKYYGAGEMTGWTDPEAFG